MHLTIKAAMTLKIIYSSHYQLKHLILFERLETLSPRHDGDYCHPSYPNICIIYYATITTILHNGARGVLRNFKGGREVTISTCGGLNKHLLETFSFFSSSLLLYTCIYVSLSQLNLLTYF